MINTLWHSQSFLCQFNKLRYFNYTDKQEMSANNNKDNDQDVEYVEVTEETRQKIEQSKNSQVTKGIIQDDRQVIKPKLTGKANDRSSQKITSKNNRDSKQQNPRQKGNKEEYRQPPREKPKHQQKNQQARNQRNHQKHQAQKISNRETNNYRRNITSGYTVTQVQPKLTLQDSQILIEDNRFEEYMKILKSLLQKHKIVTIIANGKNIVKAITISQEANQCYPNKLRRINIPGTIKVEEIYEPKNPRNKRFSKFKNISTIMIEMSLHSLDKRHMGYQDNIIDENYDRKQRKNKNPKFKERNEGEYR